MTEPDPPSPDLPSPDPPSPDPPSPDPLPPLAGVPGEGRNRLRIVLGGLIALALVIVLAVVVLTEDDSTPTSTVAADATALPPPANVASDTLASGETAPVPSELQILSIGIAPTYQCEPAATDPTILLEYQTSGAVSVSVQVDSVMNQPVQEGLPPNGSTFVPAPCAPDVNTYLITATGPDGETVGQAVQTKGV